MGCTPMLLLDAYPTYKPGDPSPVYTAGQPVTGTVSYNVYSQEKLETVDVVFKGKVTTVIVVTRTNGTAGPRGNGTSTTTRHYKEDIELFRHQKSLFRGPYTIQPTLLEWKFDFTSPEESTYVRSKGGEELRYNTKPHALPPTFDTTCGHGKAHVSYVLKVKINQGSLFRSQELDIPLVLAPTTPQAPPQPSLTMQPLPYQEWRSSRMRLQKQTLRQKLNSAFSNNPLLRTPTLALKAYIGLPTALTPWQAVPLTFSLQHVRTGPTDPEKPTIVLEFATIELEGLTSLRVLMKRRDLARESKDTAARTGSIAGGSITIPTDNTAVVLKDAFRLIDMQQIGQGIVADFKTYNISHSNRLRITVALMHSETGHRFEIKQKVPIRILAKMNTAMLQENGGPSSQYANTIPYANIESAPPSFDEKTNPQYKYSEAPVF